MKKIISSLNTYYIRNYFFINYKYEELKKFLTYYRKDVKYIPLFHLTLILICLIFIFNNNTPGSGSVEGLIMPNYSEELMKGVNSLFIYTLRLLSNENLTTPTPSRPTTPTPGPVPPTPANSPTQPGKGEPHPKDNISKFTDSSNEESIILNNSLNLDELPTILSTNREDDNPKETPPNSEDESDEKSFEESLPDNSNVLNRNPDGYPDPGNIKDPYYPQSD
jgi:hypothetical protein